MARRSPIWRRNEGGLIPRGASPDAPRAAIHGNRGVSLRSRIRDAQGKQGRPSIAELSSAFRSRRPGLNMEPSGLQSGNSLIASEQGDRPGSGWEAISVEPEKPWWSADPDTLAPRIGMNRYRDRHRRPKDFYQKPKREKVTPAWRRNQGGLIRDRAQDYRGGGMVKPRMNRYQSGGLVDAPVALEAMSMEEQVPAGLGAMMGPDVMAGPVADAAMAEPEVFPGMPNEMLTQIAGSMPPEQIGMVVEEVKLALQGRHPQGEQLLSVVEVMFPGMIEEVAMSMESTADGMTDSQLALLAPDEYVVDARTVSDLGNGSSDAGGRALDQMVQEVRMANTGTPEQPPGMDPEMFLPTGGVMP